MIARAFMLAGKCTGRKQLRVALHPGCVGTEKTQFEYTWPGVSERGEKNILSSALTPFIQNRTFEGHPSLLSAF